MNPRLAQQLENLPRGPGVYLFRDAAGEVLYIGKAKSLRARVRSYFQARGDGRVAVRFIEEKVADIEVILTRSEKEAFLLENNLIKQQKPRYNIRLRDDKTYLHLRVDRRHPYPAIVPMRRPRKDGAMYFGPFSSARAIRTTLRMLREVFPLRDCTDFEFANRTRPCLKYQIKTCSAPCVDYITPQDYAALLEGAVRVLRGDTQDLAQSLTEEMKAASERQEYERAGVLRDRIAFLRNSTDAQAVEVNRQVDRDVVGLYRRGRWVEISVLLFRDGKLLSASPFSFQTDLPDDEALSMFVSQFYGGGRPVPAEVLLPREIYAGETLAEWLGERRGRPVALKVPRSGAGARAIEMACRNAELSLQASREEHSLSERILDEVQRRLDLPVRPRHVECLDISHLQGAQTVASLVRFEDGEPHKDGYRRFRLREAGGGDDYGAMREVVRRRFGKRVPDQPFPELLLVDGGRGQVNVVHRTLEELGIEGVAVAGIVKPERRGRGLLMRGGLSERIILPGVEEARELPPESEACYFLQRVRDEAHRFAITYHRRLRSRGLKTSVLEDVEGLGAGRARKLLLHFGGLKALKAASAEQLAQVPGIGPTLAERIYTSLHST